jgi:hypothetical protein
VFSSCLKSSTVMNKMFGGETSFCLVSQEEKSKGKQRKSNKIDFFNLSVWLSFFLKI